MVVCVCKSPVQVMILRVMCLKDKVLNQLPSKVTDSVAEWKGAVDLEAVMC